VVEHCLTWVKTLGSCTIKGVEGSLGDDGYTCVPDAGIVSWILWFEYEIFP
jgi:hypothetical protein